jgi:hypothetical protein
MKELIKASFEQNPQALQRLLATGDATLTHTQDKSKWGTEFPKLLMEVRDELRKDSVSGDTDAASIQNMEPVSPYVGQSSSVIQQIIDHLKSIITPLGLYVKDRAAIEQYLKDNPNAVLQQAVGYTEEM